MFNMHILESQVFILVFQFTTTPSAEVKNGGAMPPLPLFLHGTLPFTNVILQHSVSLHRSDFAFCFCAVYVQLRLLFALQFSSLTLHVSA
jgi:hypothetical protein